MATNNTNNRFFQIFQSIGSSTGAIVAIGGLMSMSAGAGAYLMKINKDSEILDIKTQHSLILIEKREELSEYKDQVRYLKFKINQDSTKQTNEKGSK